MANITLYLSEDDQRMLEDSSTRSGISPKRLGERILRRELIKDNGRPRSSNKDLGLERATRQARVVHHLRKVGGVAALDRDAKRQLAEKLGVNERTLYRDLEVAEAVLKLEASENGLATPTSD